VEPSTTRKDHRLEVQSASWGNFTTGSTGVWGRPFAYESGETRTSTTISVIQTLKRK